MADYRKAILKVLLTEGGYVNDPSDNGGETYRGIARKFWPSWGGWSVIDQAKKTPNWKAGLKNNSTLNEMVVIFYRTNFWVKIGGDYIKDQDIAYMLVDTAVLEGIKPAIKKAQEIVGISQTGDVSPLLLTKLCLLA